jgi:DNA-binding PadR family transcriptional regulator
MKKMSKYWRIDFAQLNRSLAKMTQVGWVNRHVERGTDRPSREIYALTPSDCNALERWIAEPPKDRDEFFVTAANSSRE